MNFDLPSLGFNALSTLHVLRPHWLWLLLALPLLAWWWRRRQVRQSVWRDVIDPHLLAHLLQGHAGVRGQGALWLGMLCFSLVVCALAGPSWQRVEQPLWQSRAPLVIALDLSRTITATDLQPSRLAQARAKIATLLKARAGGQVALVAYADDAYTVAPLTDDADNVALYLDALAPGIMPSDNIPGGGMRSDAGMSFTASEPDDSKASRAIAWSSGLLKQAGFDHGDILLLSDHAGGAARDAASTAQKAGYRVSALGLGTAKGAAYRDGAGRIEKARLDADSLRAMASAGGGGYATLSTSDRDLVAIDVLDPRQAGTMAARGEKTNVWRDQGYWLLLPVLLLAALAFRRGGALAVVLVCVCLPLSQARAADGDWWRRPDQQQHQQLEQGVQAYQDKDYAAAEKQWDGLPGADAAYNRGNALARQGQYDEAIAQYDKALKLHPGMDDAVANRKVVLAAKKRKPPSGKQQGQKDQKDKDGKGKDQESKDEDSRDGKQDKSGQSDSQGGNGKKQSASGEKKDSKRQDGRQPQANPSDANKAKPNKPADAEAQRKADAAQHQRMQQALAKARQGKQDKQGKGQVAKPHETPAERERRVANEAWLRRVPDDPGGLLRARFLLEYQRRQQGGDQ